MNCLISTFRSGGRHFFSGSGGLESSRSAGGLVRHFRTGGGGLFRAGRGGLILSGSGVLPCGSGEGSGEVSSEVSSEVSGEAEEDLLRKEDRLRQDVLFRERLRVKALMFDKYKKLLGLDAEDPRRKALIRTSPPIPPFLDPVVWVAPPPGWIQANSDGSVLTKGKRKLGAGIAVLYRDDMGLYRDALQKTEKPDITSTQAEMLAIQKAIQKALAMKIDALYIKTDEQGIVNMCKDRNPKYKWEGGQVGKELKVFHGELQYIWDIMEDGEKDTTKLLVRLEWMDRACNRPADYLAGQAALPGGGFRFVAYGGKLYWDAGDGTPNVDKVLPKNFAGYIMETELEPKG